MWRQNPGDVDRGRAVNRADDADGGGFVLREAEQQGQDQGQEDAELSAAPSRTNLGLPEGFDIVNGLEEGGAVSTDSTSNQSLLEAFQTIDKCINTTITSNNLSEEFDIVTGLEEGGIVGRTLNTDLPSNQSLLEDFQTIDDILTIPYSTNSCFDLNNLPKTTDNPNN